MAHRTRCQTQTYTCCRDRAKDDEEQKDKKQEIVKEKTATKVSGYGCAGCGNKIYQAVEVWETREILEPSEFKHEHKPVTHWQCEGCGAVFEIIGGSKGPQIIN
jgi:hypothetical protein